jgi:hypothetical protein
MASPLPPNFLLQASCRFFSGAACKGRADLRAQAIAVNLNPPQVGLGERRLKNSSNWD